MGHGIVLSIGGYPSGIVNVTTAPAPPAEVVTAAMILFLSLGSGKLIIAIGAFAIFNFHLLSLLSRTL